MKIVGIVDDDKTKHGKFMHGIKVIGDRNDIIDIAESRRVDEIIIAMPSTSAKEMKQILDICKQTACELKRLPGMFQFPELCIRQIVRVMYAQVLVRRR